MDIVAKEEVGPAGRPIRWKVDRGGRSWNGLQPKAKLRRLSKIGSGVDWDGSPHAKENPRAMDQMRTWEKTNDKSFLYCC